MTPVEKEQFKMEQAIRASKSSTPKTGSKKTIFSLSGRPLGEVVVVKARGSASKPKKS